VPNWIESGLEMDGKQPDRKGFGIELLEHSLPYDLDAETEFDFRPDGLHFQVSMPLSNSAGVD